jgi:hypothetical protein
MTPQAKLELKEGSTKRLEVAKAARPEVQRFD